MNSAVISIVKDNQFSLVMNGELDVYKYDTLKEANQARTKMVKFFRDQDGVKLYFTKRKEG